ncbi:uncharacterized protein LOC133192972 [Saccostrea echinata]|uniref:uncharacterized protein LOC133192972 n=1 Tax=Saccostrea echinata TaxID=191078 RepID=UPI002A820BFD|nr:uncharacterized protein LOC133192972 [Saccostrea echinata]
MWKVLLLILNITSVVCQFGSSDFFSLSPFERSAFEGVPGIPGDQLYKMADGSVSDAIKLRARLSMSAAGAQPVPIAVPGNAAPAVPITVSAGGTASMTTPVAGGGAAHRTASVPLTIGSPAVLGGTPTQIPSFYALLQPQPFGASQLAYIPPGYPSPGMNYNMAALAFID